MSLLSYCYMPVYLCTLQTQYEATQTEVVCTCLEVVGKFVSWIDIGLVANDKFVPVIIRFMSNPLLRESACDCIHDVVSKGMDPVAKTKLVESFTDVLDNVGVLNLSEVRFSLPFLITLSTCSFYCTENVLVFIWNTW